MFLVVYQWAYEGTNQPNHTGEKQRGGEKYKQILWGLRKTPLRGTKLHWLKNGLILLAPSVMHPPAPHLTSAARASLNADPGLYNQRDRTGKKQAAKGSSCAPACSEPPEGSCKAIPPLTTVTPESCWIPAFKIDLPNMHPLVWRATAIHINQSTLPKM